jgi:hypothetical protein
MIAKLPKWAQEHIKGLERERFVAVRSLNEFTDKQTPSPFYHEDYVCSGEQQGPTKKRNYIQASSLIVESFGIELTVILRDEEKAIDLQWVGVNLHGHVAMIPRSFQKVYLVSSKHLRT